MWFWYMCMIFMFFYMFIYFFFFFKQKTAYEMRISDWSSDVCSSDLNARAHGEEMLPTAELHIGTRHRVVALDDCRIEGRHKSGMQKIEKIGYRGTQPFNLLSIDCVDPGDDFFRSIAARSEEHTSELQSLMRISYAVFCLKKNNSHPITPIVNCLSSENTNTHTTN